MATTTVVEVDTTTYFVIDLSACRILLTQNQQLLVHYQQQQLLVYNSTSNHPEDHNIYYDQNELQIHGQRTPMLKSHSSSTLTTSPVLLDCHGQCHRSRGTDDNDDPGRPTQDDPRMRSRNPGFAYYLDSPPIIAHYCYYYYHYY